MYKVKTKFKDIQNPRHVYNVGDEFLSDNTVRVKRLLEWGFIVEVKTATKAKVGDKYGDDLKPIKN